MYSPIRRKGRSPQNKICVSYTIIKKNASQNINIFLNIFEYKSNILNYKHQHINTFFCHWSHCVTILYLYTQRNIFWIWSRIKPKIRLYSLYFRYDLEQQNKRRIPFSSQIVENDKLQSWNFEFVSLTRLREYSPDSVLTFPDWGTYRLSSVQQLASLLQRDLPMRAAQG